MNEFALNRGQVKKLAAMMDQLPAVEWFTLVAENSSGIGSTVAVKFNLFGDGDKDTDTTVNITDVSTW